MTSVKIFVFTGIALQEGLEVHFNGETSWPAPSGILASTQLGLLVVVILRLLLITPEEKIVGKFVKNNEQT